MGFTCVWLLSELHTNWTALRLCVCMQTLIINCEWAHSNISGRLNACGLLQILASAWKVAKITQVKCHAILQRFSGCLSKCVSAICKVYLFKLPTSLNCYTQQNLVNGWLVVILRWWTLRLLLLQLDKQPLYDDTYPLGHANLAAWRLSSCDSFVIVRTFVALVIECCCLWELTER